MAILGFFLFLLFVAVSVFFYMLPTIIAHRRGHKQLSAICVFNIALGWTGVGWIIALTWAYLKPGGLA